MEYVAGSVERPPAGKHPKSERQLELIVLHAVSELARLPVTPESIENARNNIDNIEKLYNKCIDECKRGEWAVTSYMPV